MKYSTLAFALIPLATAQQTAWGQCGGNGWSGAKTCVSGYTCQVLNEWYSQCVPGSAGSPTTTTRAVATTTTSRAVATTTTSRAAATTTSAPPSSGGGSYVTRSGMKFNIDGKVGYFAGTNSYWIGFLTNNADVDTVMAHLKATGLKVLRVWGFNDATSASGVYYQLFSGGTVTINTGPNGLQRLDYVVSSAEKYGIKLIIPFVNNWDDYGGMNAYAKFFGKSHNDFYTDSRIIDQYKKYIAAVVSRYKNSKAIFAWELANEARCSGCATSVITNWASSISAYIKSLDANHLVTLGDEGFMSGGGDGSYPYQGGEGIDFVKNLAISTLDFGVMHLYPDSWGVSNSWANSWITNHANAAKAAGKPVILEEYGAKTDRTNVLSDWYRTILASEVAGDMYWQFGDQLSSGQTHNDGYTMYYGSSDYNNLVAPHTSNMNAK